MIKEILCRDGFIPKFKLDFNKIAEIFEQRRIEEDFLSPQGFEFLPRCINILAELRLYFSKKTYEVFMKNDA